LRRTKKKTEGMTDRLQRVEIDRKKINAGIEEEGRQEV
jgi:hypothetical protein